MQKGNTYILKVVKTCFRIMLKHVSAVLLLFQTNVPCFIISCSCEKSL